MSSRGHQRLMRDRQKLRTLLKTFDGAELQKEDGDGGGEEDSLDSLTVIVTPTEGFYRGARIRFRLQCGNYPARAPDVVCLDNVFHPNIDPSNQTDTNVCFSWLTDWRESMTLTHVVCGLSFLFKHPNIANPLAPSFSYWEAEHWNERSVRRSLHGRKMDHKNQPFARLLVESDDEAEDDAAAAAAADEADREEDRQSAGCCCPDRWVLMYVDAALSGAGTRALAFLTRRLTEAEREFEGLDEDEEVRRLVLRRVTDDVLLRKSDLERRAEIRPWTVQDSQFQTDLAIVTHKLLTLERDSDALDELRNARSSSSSSSSSSSPSNKTLPTTPPTPHVV